MTAWLVPADLLVTNDQRIVGQFLSDSALELTEQQILASTKLIDASNGILARAMGRVEAAALAGNRYSAADLAGLTGNRLAHLKEIGSIVAMAMLVGRRVGLHAEFAKESRELAEYYLDALRSGKDLFSLGNGSVEEAAVPDTSEITYLDYRNVNTLADQCYGRFPDRSQRLPQPQG